jgi:hypothetical protein
MNKQARKKLCGQSSLSIVPGASHLFEEPGTLEEVGWLASEFFLKCFPAKDASTDRHENLAARVAPRKTH